MAATPRALWGERDEILPLMRRAFWVGTAALVGIALTFGSLYLVHRRSTFWVLHSREVARLAREARARASDRQASIRVFALTGSSTSLALELTAREELARGLDSLDIITREDGAQHQRARTIRYALERWDREFASPMLSLGRDSTRSMLGAERHLHGQALFESVKGAFFVFLSTEDALYRHHQRRSEAIQRAALAAVLIEILFLFGALTWLRRRAVGQATQLVEQQEQLEEQAVELEAQAAELEEQTHGMIASGEQLSVTNRDLAATVERLENAQETTQRAIREKDEALTHLEVVLASAPVGFAFYDRNLRYQPVNRALAAVNGISPEDHLGRTVSELFPQQSALVETHCRHVLSTGRPVMNVALSRQAPSEPGRERHWLASFYPVRTSQNQVEGIGVMLLETTEQKRLEEQFLQSQKMEAVGRLAGGIAHDFNNMLTAIKSYCELLLEDIEQEDDRRGDVEEINKAANRAATLTRQLLAFSRQQILQPEILDINATVSDLEKMLGRLIGADVKLDARLDSDLGHVKADRGQLEQLLMNLVVNARDAMPDGGRLTIETANVELNGEYANVDAAAVAGPYVMLAVSDTGCGMSRETQAHIFEPFFTTKEKGKGTGLGLATVYGIVKQSSGSLWVYSEPGCGTTFKIYLPRAVSETLDLRLESPVSLACGGSETILLVEDDDSVRGVASRILRRAGYTVLEAVNGAEAFDIFSAPTSLIDLILTDIVMPEVSGGELARRIREVRPDMLILFTSGYTEDEVMRRSLLEPSAAFIEKPFTPHGLARRVREVLDLPAFSATPT